MVALLNILKEKKKSQQTAQHDRGSISDKNTKHRLDSALCTVQGVPIFTGMSVGHTEQGIILLLGKGIRNNPTASK